MQRASVTDRRNAADVLLAMPRLLGLQRRLGRIIKNLGENMKTTVKKGKKTRNKTAKELLRDTKKAAGSMKRKLLGK